MSSDELRVVKAFVEFLYKGFYSFDDRTSIDECHSDEGCASENGHSGPSMHLPTPGGWSESTSAQLPLRLENAEDDAEQLCKIHRAKDRRFHVKMYIAGDFLQCSGSQGFCLE